MECLEATAACLVAGGFDLLVPMGRQMTDALIKAARAAGKKLGASFREWGREGGFGKPHRVIVFSLPGSLRRVFHFHKGEGRRTILCICY